MEWRPEVVKKKMIHDIVMMNVNDEFSFSPSRQLEKPEPYVIPAVRFLLPI